MKPIDQNLWWEKNLDDGYKWNEFISWLRMSDASSRKFIYNFIDNNILKINSVLEVGPGSFIDYDYFFNKQKIDYNCIDITTKIIEIALSKNIKAKLGSIKDIPHNDYSFDLVYTRHVLEHIDYYTEGILELLRVSDKYIVCTFFHLDKTSDADTIVIDSNTKLYHNIYSKKKINKFLDTLELEYNWYECKKDTVLIIEKKYDILY